MRLVDNLHDFRTLPEEVEGLNRQALWDNYLAVLQPSKRGVRKDMFRNKKITSRAAVRQFYYMDHFSCCDLPDARGGCGPGGGDGGGKGQHGCRSCTNRFLCRSPRARPGWDGKGWKEVSRMRRR
eukprot:6174577-Pyramimonas_sp.AAC.1